MAWDGKIPFDHEGNQMHYPEKRWNSKNQEYIEPEWQDNFEFWGPIIIKDIRRGRSAAYFTVEFTPFASPRPFRSLNLCEGTMFMTDFLNAIKRAGALPGGSIPGIFTFVKRGQNYGVKLV